MQFTWDIVRRALQYPQPTMKIIYIWFLALLVFWQLLDIRATSYLCFDETFENGSLEGCVPLCKPECVNGDCENGVCSCHEHFHLMDGQCQSKCTEPCDENAECSENGCECKTGYFAENGVCFPICSFEDLSPNRYCVAPATTECLPGYVEVNGACVPLCDPACTPNAICIAPNTCRCVEGFEREIYSFILYLVVIGVLAALVIVQLAVFIWTYVRYRTQSAKRPGIEPGTDAQVLYTAVK